MITFKRFTMTCILFFLLYGCATTPPERLPEVTQAAVDDQRIQHATIVAGSYWFRPARVMVKVDMPVELSVRKEPGIVPHSFVIDAPQAGIDVDVSLSTESKDIRFVPKQVGTYTFYCDRGLFESHREKGMVGVLEVTE